MKQMSDIILAKNETVRPFLLTLLDFKATKNGHWLCFLKMLLVKKMSFVFSTLNLTFSYSLKIWSHRNISFLTLFDV